MLFRRHDPGEPHRLAIVRDLVEIVAIALAGIWAIYVFIYTDRIEPFQKPVAPAVDASMNVVGAKGDLLAVRISQSMKNVGPVELYIMGTVANVSGYNVRIPDARTLHSVPGRPQQVVYERYSMSHFETAFTYVVRGGPKLSPGNTWSYSSIIYVPRNRYDTLVLDSSFAYTRNRNAAPVSIVRNKRGIPFLNGRDIDTSGSEIQVSLWH